jgi:hypothetical protein
LKLGLRYRLTECDTRNLISGRESIIRRWLRVALLTPHTRLPIRNFENATGVRCKEKDPRKHSEDPEPLVPLSGLWSRSVSARRQGLFLEPAHADRLDDGLR